MALITSAPTMLQAPLKKAEIRPSGPGALLGFTENIRFVISVVVGMIMILPFCDKLHWKGVNPWNQSGPNTDLKCSTA